MFRPMPYETHSPQELASAFENLALLGILLWMSPRIFHAIRRSRHRPYFLYCFGTLIVFIVEYSSFSNFAIIARQRTQVIALLFVFLCVSNKETVVVDTPAVRTRTSPAQPDA